MIEFSPEQEAFRKVVREFAESEIAPHAFDWDQSHTFPVDTVLAMGELGLLGLPLPEEYGGSGADFATFCIALEELGRVDQSMAVTVEAAVGLGANPILEFGTEEQRQEWLPDLCAGTKLGGFGLTEPEAGSDAGGTRTRARLDEATDEWVIDGSKAFITNSGSSITSLVTITARTDAPSSDGSPEISTIIVPAGTDGFTVAPPYRKMGWHASDTHELSFADCRVPAANLLGERGRGFAQFLATLDDGRIALAAVAVGVIQSCLEESVAYAKERNAFGAPIGRFQAVSFKCADMKTMLDAARLLTYQAAALKDAGRPFKEAAAVAKLVATESAVTATRMATQIFGGAGFMDTTLVARHYRDAKILEIGEGTSEVQRLVISRSLGLG
ncbi:MAG TPA: acyl-CoA dehydrogenase family protein [Acidimicrobiales bacterium]|nr:acyl-CoA dehydrogenase family protein [Acidimicrobiales bacterium]